MEKPPEYLTDKSEYDEDQGLTKLLRRCKENPTLPVGFAAFVGIGIWGALNFNKTKERKSIFLIRLRVAAQGTVIGLLTLGAFTQIYKQEQKRRQGIKSD